MGARLTRAALAGLVVWLAVSSGVAAQGRVLLPGLEERVSALVFAGTDPAELAPGVGVDGAQIEAAHIDVTLAGDGARGRVRLVERDTTSDGEHVGDTPSFSLYLVEGAGIPVIRAAASALRDRIARRDEGGFFARHASSADSGAARATPGWRAPVRGALWAALLVGLVVLGVRARSRGARLPREDAAIATALFAASLALRLFVPPWAPLHANDHGISEMRGLVGGSDAQEAALYGTAYLDFARACLAPFGRWPSGPFALAAIAGALAPALLFAVARTLAPDRRWGALLAAIALVVHPAHARLSLSETPKPLAGALWLLGVLLALSALGPGRERASRDLATVLTAIAWGLALELHVLTMLLPFAGIAFVLAAGFRRDVRPSSAAIAIGVGIVGAIALGHFGELDHGLRAASERTFEPRSILHRLFGGDDLLLDPTLTSPIVLPLAALGAASIWRRGRRLVVAVLLATAILLPPSMLICASRTDAIRYQSEAHYPLFVLLLGVPFPAGARAWLGAAIALVIAASIPGLVDASRPDVHAAAYAIAIRRAPVPPTPIRIAAHRMRDEVRVLADFPDYAIVAPSRVSTEAATPCEIWIGVACWSFTRDELSAGATGVEIEPGAPFRAECVELLGGVAAARIAMTDLEPVEVPHRDREFHVIVAEHPRVGYAACPP